MTALPIRMRPDLLLEAVATGNDSHWVATDPIALRYFRLRDEERFILQRLDGEISLENLHAQFEAAFRPLRIRPQDLNKFVARLHELGLTVANTPGQGDVLWQKTERAHNERRKQWWGSLLAFRLPGVSAEPIVRVLAPWCGWVLSSWFLTAIGGIAGLAILGILLQWETFQAKLANSHSLFVPQAAITMLVVVSVVKALHELGHALACRRCGVQCHEMGMMLLVGTPTLYCDVTDAWRLPSKWDRIFISAAGMFVELFLAIIALCIWWNTNPGWINSLALQVLAFCSLGTLFFNLNPLVRSDGYYMMSDFFELPNLWGDARLLLRQRILTSLLGLEFQDDPTIAPNIRPKLLFFAVASVVYSWILTFGIVIFLQRIMDPHGLRAVAVMIGLFAFAGLLAAPITNLFQALSYPGRRPLRRGRISTVLSIGLLLIGSVLFLPLPKTVIAPVWLEPAVGQGIYTSVAGRLEEVLVRPGATVATGEPLARLSNAELAMQIAELTQATDLQQTKLKNLRLMLADDPTAAPLLPAAEKALADYRERLKQRQRESQRLTLVATTAGTVIPPPKHSPRTLNAGQLPTWQGSPFEPHNRSCYLELGTEFCQIAPSSKFIAFAVVTEEQHTDLSPQQSVRIKFATLPGVIITGKVIDIAKGADRDLSEARLLALQLPVERPTRTSSFAAANTAHQQHYSLARIELAPTNVSLLVDQLGQAQISAAWEPLAPRIGRWFCQAFQPE